MSGFLLAPCWFITIALHYSLKSGVVLSSSVLLLRTALAIWVLGLGGEVEDKAPVICHVAVGFGVLGFCRERRKHLPTTLWASPASTIEPVPWLETACYAWSCPGTVWSRTVGSDSNSSNCFWTLGGNPSVCMCSCSLQENWYALGVSLRAYWHRAASIVTVASVNSCSLHSKEALA